MKRTPTDLRAHLYEVLDHVAQTGESVEVVRAGVQLRIVRDPAAPKKAKPRTLPNLIVGDSAEIIHMQWPWKAGSDL